jgi:hypothetical protein
MLREMKYIKLNTLVFVFVVFMYSCSTQKKVAKQSAYKESYSKYLSSVINDTVFYEFTQYSIVDKSIYPILDSAILLSEQCTYFDSKVKYLNSFGFNIRYMNDKSFYSIDAHLSPYQAVGLVLVEAGIKKKVDILGIFFYKNYLFVIPTSSFGEQKEINNFPFVKKTDKILKIRAPKFYKEKTYSSYLNFAKTDSSYKIVENQICGERILIQ